MRALLIIALLPPVPGALTRGFAYAGDPFAAGHHRGVDLAARPGGEVRAACAGRVVFAGRAGANGGVVTIRCGRFNVTHLPLASLAARAGDRVSAGTRLGTAGRGRDHAGLHLGVRRVNDPLGYVDPAPLLRATPRPAPPAGPRRIARRTTPPHHPGPAPRPAPRPAPQPAAPSPAPGSSPPVAPWPAWAGLALLLCGAVGARGARARRRRRASLPQATPAPVP